jgi:hypothetical protein
MQIHAHTVTTTDVANDLGELAEILLLLVCKPFHYTMGEIVTFQTASHIHVIYL